MTAALLLNGAHARMLALNTRRPDVRHAFAHMEVAERCGFSEQVACNLLSIVDGAVEVSVYVRDTADYALTLGPITVRFQDGASSSATALSSEQEAWLYHDRIEFARSDEEFAAHIRTRTAIKSTDVVLEIGCGAGRTARHLAPWCGQWIGIDISAGVLENAEAQLSGFQNVELMQTNGYELSMLPARSVDVVYCSVVFMVLPEWDRFNYVTEAYRVLKPGGRLYVDTMNLLGAESWSIFSAFSRMSAYKRPPNLCRTATPQELETYFLRAGFGEIEVVSGSIFVECTGKKRP